MQHKCNNIQQNTEQFALIMHGMIALENYRISVFILSFDFQQNISLILTGNTNKLSFASNLTLEQYCDGEL